MCKKRETSQASTFVFNISDDIYTRNGVLTIIKDISDHERMMMVGENELTEIEAELLERSRRSFYRLKLVRKG